MKEQKEKRTEGEPDRDLKPLCSALAHIHGLTPTITQILHICCWR